MLCNKYLVRSICTTACKQYIDKYLIGKKYDSKFSVRLKDHIITIDYKSSLVEDVTKI